MKFASRKFKFKKFSKIRLTSQKNINVVETKLEVRYLSLVSLDIFILIYSVAWRFSIKMLCFGKFSKTQIKMPVLEYSLNEIAILKTVKKTLVWAFSCSLFDILQIYFVKQLQMSALVFSGEITWRI